MRLIRGLSAFSAGVLHCNINLSVVLGGLTVMEASTDRARAAGYESLMVPSAAMGRDIPVAFLAGGPHAVYLLDAFDAGPDVSNWVTAGNAMNTLAGKGISVAAPAGGAYSMYTNWEQDGSKQWDTFLSSELPDGWPPTKVWRPVAMPPSAPAQGGYAAMALAAFHPDRFGYAGSMSGFVSHRKPRSTGRSLPACSSSAESTAMECGAPPNWAGGSGTTLTSIPPCWSRNNTRLWMFSPQTLTASDPASMMGVADQAQGSQPDVLPAIPQRRRA